jgi:hypothetical protein
MVHGHTSGSAYGQQQQQRHQQQQQQPCPAPLYFTRDRANTDKCTFYLAVLYEYKVEMGSGDPQYQLARYNQVCGSYACATTHSAFDSVCREKGARGRDWGKHRPEEKGDRRAMIAL